MDHNETSTFTPFDYMTQTRELQMLKTMLPYMKDTQKKQFAILIKYMELRAFCTSKEQETIDMLANMFSMLETYETIFS